MEKRKFESSEPEKKQFFTKKFRHSSTSIEDFEKIASTFKVPEFSQIPAWNFDHRQDDIIKLTEGAYVPPRGHLPQPHMEVLRAKKIAELRGEFEDLCWKHLRISAPSESFNRWLFEQLAIPTKDLINAEGKEGKEKEEKEGILPLEPILRKPEVALESEVLRRELNANLPASLYISWGAKTKAWKGLKILEEFCEKALDKLKDTRDEEVKATQKLIWEEQDWISSNSRIGDPLKVVERIKAIKEKTTPVFTRLYKPAIDLICKELVDLARIVIQELREEKAKEPTPKSQATLTREDDQNWAISYEGTKLIISDLHVNKLWRLYSINSGADDPTKQHFFNRLFSLVLRYDTFFGTGAREGSTFHAAATEVVFDAMRDKFSVSQENYASPFNCYFRTFNSAFPDTDVFFGSRGSFYDFSPQTGSFETGPPYTEEVMERMIYHLESLLRSPNAGPLSFFVFVPDWREPLQVCQQIMESKEFPFTREIIHLNGGKYFYVSGDQHKKRDATNPKERFFALPFETKIYLLQNDLGKEKWPANAALMKELDRILHLDRSWD